MEIVPEHMAEIAHLAEERGFDSVWVNDHVVIPDEFGANYPFRSDGVLSISSSSPFADALITLAYVAGITERVRLGVSVLVLPYHHPLDTAKKAATLDVLSGGRLILGVGVGWMREEFDALGVDFDTKTRNFDEQLEIMRAAWTQPTVSYQGEIFSFDPVGVEPRPPRPEGVSVWMGGHSKATLRRACRHSEAVHWVAEDVEEIKRRTEELGRIAEEEGLTQLPEVTLRGRLAVEDDVTPFETAVLVGPESYLIEKLSEYAEAGVTHFMIDRRKGGYDAMRGSFDELAPVLDALSTPGELAAARTS
jgi:probable F420-dependent oxidoreductase